MLPAKIQISLHVHARSDQRLCCAYLRIGTRTQVFFMRISNTSQTGWTPMLFWVFRSVRVAERLVLLTSDHRVAGSNPAGGEILPEPKRRFIAQSLSCSPFHRLEMTEILLKGRKTLTHPSMFWVFVGCTSFYFWFWHAATHTTSYKMAQSYGGYFNISLLTICENQSFWVVKERTLVHLFGVPHCKVHVPAFFTFTLTARVS